MSESTPAQIGRYRIIGELGRGAMGIVYRAEDPLLDRPVAIKTIIMSADPQVRAEYEKRFYQEAKAAGGLNHPNLITIHDIGREGDLAYMAMELLEGVELREMMRQGRIELRVALDLLAQVAEGLAYAHERGVVHRDIKPANIMVVANGPVKITDFGIARMRGTGDLTQAGTLLGSPKYMSPEQVIGKRADHRSDIFSLGVILYEMLCGSAPFNGENVTALMYQIVNFVPPAPSSINPAVLQVLDHIVAKMLAKPLEERYQDATELAADLRECERQLGASEGATQPPRTLPGFAPAPQPRLVDADAKNVVLAQTLNRTRVADQAPEELPSSPARGLAQSFDSLEATQRLATLTGASVKPEEAPPTATQVIRSIGRPPESRRWRRRDWLLVAAAAVGGLVVAGSIVRRRKRS